MTRLAIALLLASTAGAGAQVARNGPEYGGKDHQPAETQTLQAERRAGVRPPKAQVEQNDRALNQIDRKLLRQEGLSPSSAPTPPPSR